MGFRSWRLRVGWLHGLALAGLAVSPSLAGAWGGESLSLTLPQSDGSQRLAAIPLPPEPPKPFSSEDGVESPSRPVEDTIEPARTPETRAGPVGPLTLDDPIFEDPRAEPPVSVPPGIPVPSYPIIMNAPVEAVIDLFIARDRDRFGLWMSRSGRYLGMIQRVFRERGLPEELAYTAMIESGFSPRAVSRVGAKGMWQFMEATARRYGLLVNRWVDERLDPVKSTIAAAQYLGDLYGMFGHWFLAQAAYNAGEARIGRAIQRAKSSDFWVLTQTPHLPDETKLFVPQILAAAIITQQPARYGFDVVPEAPLAYDEVTVRHPLDFETLAQLAGVSVGQIRDLNPALLGQITPPFGAYTLRLPVGTGARFEAALQNTPPSRLPAWGIHRVGRNQSLAEIARQYRTTPQRLAEVNYLPGGRLRGVSELVVPVSRKVASPEAIRGEASKEPLKPAASRTVAVARSREVLVRRGDTLWRIATRYGLKPQTLARLNGLNVDEPLQAGARVKIDLP